jgi:hypothetical protein
MSTETLRIIIAIVLIAHGIGHSLGILPAIGMKLTEAHSSDSWLLTRLLGSTISRVLALILFLGALIGFIGAGLGLFDWLVPSDLWQQLSVWASIISLVGLAIFPNAFPAIFPNLVGAVGLDIAVLVAVLWLKWPPGIVLG